MKGRTIGLLGGSFNPAHGGHRAISLFAAKALGLDEVWWLVSPGNPLKPKSGMAPLPARLAHARKFARRAPIRATTIEQDLGTRYTIDTLRALIARYPRNRFIWLMGGDNLEQFGQWRDWRKIARIIPIAVIARPGYNAQIRGSSAMSWLRRFVRPVHRSRNWTEWRPPALMLLRFRPDPRSATLLRQDNPLWFHDYDDKAVRDSVSRHVIRAVQPLSAAE
jgi:nicotinate-nucleotide adenylyltransferase